MVAGNEYAVSVEGFAMIECVGGEWWDVGGEYCIVDASSGYGCFDCGSMIMGWVGLMALYILVLTGRWGWGR